MDVLRVRMLQTAVGAVDEAGTCAETHYAGSVVDLLASTAAVYVAEGWATTLLEDAPLAPVEAPAPPVEKPARNAAVKPPAKRKSAGKRK